MTNNDILRRLRYTFNFNDNKMVALFALADHQVTREQISSWLKKEEDDDYVNCTDTQLAIFLNGFINDRRGKKDGPQHAPEKRITNNIILTKLKIALNLRTEDIIALLASVDLRIGKAELSAFSRKPDHKHYRVCKDQIIRNFLQAIQIKYRVEPAPKTPKVKEGVSSDKKSNQKPGNKPNHKSMTTSGAGKSDKKSSVNTMYVNPNATVKDKPKPTRKVLKLKAEDIWK